LLVAIAALLGQPDNRINRLLGKVHPADRVALLARKSGKRSEEKQLIMSLEGRPTTGLERADQHIPERGVEETGSQITLATDGGYLLALSKSY
jgi:hypothetical protein